MTLRSGADYLASLRDSRDVWLHGHKVADVTTEPGLKRGAATLAGLLDRQASPEWSDPLSFAEPDGSRSATSFMIPRSAENIRQRGRAYYEWAKWSHGMFGRTPDYKNASVMAFAATSDFLNSGTAPRPADFAANMRAYFTEAKRKDYVLTHTLVNPQFNAERVKQGLSSPEVALQVVDDSLTVWVELINATGRKNVGGLEHEYEELEDGGYQRFTDGRTLLPRVPSIGVLWKFR